MNKENDKECFALKTEAKFTKKQNILVNKTLGCCRFIYNDSLDYKISMYLNDKVNINEFQLNNRIPMLKSLEQYSFLKEVDSAALQQSVKDLMKAFDRFYKKQGGFPKFKKKSYSQNYRTINNNNCIKIVDKKFITLPKLGKVRLRITSNFENRIKDKKIKSVTVERSSTGKYYVSILFENINKEKDITDNKDEVLTISKLEEYIKNNKVIGIDLGIKDFSIDSNGKKTENPRYLDKSLKRLKREQRKLSKKEEHSNNYEKQRLLVAKCHEKIFNQRTDFLQKESTRIINENQVIILEDLNVKGMIRNHKLARHISDVSWGRFVKLLEDKAKKQGKIIVKIDRYYPSSQLCSCCGYQNHDLTLQDRFWTCPVCLTFLDRDDNAAVNIKEEGIRILFLELSA